MAFHAASGQWCKKVRGKIFYFGKDSTAAEEKYREEIHDLQAGRVPRRRQTGVVTVRDVVNAFLRSKQALVDSHELSDRTFAQYLRTGRRFTEAMGGHRAMTDLRPEDFTEFRASLSARAVRWSPSCPRPAATFKLLAGDTKP